VAAASGDRARALASFHEAERAAGVLGFRPLCARAQAEAAALLDATGSPEDAAAERAVALAIVDEMAAPIQDAGLRGGFVATARKRLARASTWALAV
jgi:hypothetical protein